MKIKLLLCFLTFFFSLNLIFCQKQKELSDFSIKKVGVIKGNHINFADMPIRVKIEDKSLDFFAICCLITKKQDIEIDPNKFFIIDKSNKLRYRLVDIISIKSIGSGIEGGEKYITEIPWENKEHNVYNIWSAREKIYFDPKVVDKFYDYSIEGYENISYKVDFGTKKESLVSEMYYSPITYKKKLRTFLRFAVSRHHKKESFYLYYGDKELFEIIRKRM